jgi:hypothetical protein
MSADVVFHETTLRLELDKTASIEIEGNPPLLIIGAALQGPPGIPGASGAGYVHTQGSPSATWTIAHNLGFRPSVSVSSVGGIEVFAEVAHISNTLLEVRFVLPFSGTARLS